MPQRMARLFIASALVFFVIGCIEGMMFPTKFKFQFGLSRCEESEGALSGIFPDSRQAPFDLECVTAFKLFSTGACDRRLLQHNR